MKTVFEARASAVIFRLAAAVPRSRGVFLLPANICPVVPLALVAAERKFEFVDLDPETLCPSSGLLQERLGAAGRRPVAAVIYARSYGAPLDAEPLFEALRRQAPDLLIVDDRCLSVPIPEAEKMDAKGADAVLFSTGYSKPVDLGYGGFAHLRDHVPYSSREREYDPADLERITELYKSHIRSQTTMWSGDEAVGDRSSLAGLRWLDTGAPETPWLRYAEAVRREISGAEAHRARVNAVYRRWIPRGVQLGPGFHGWRFQMRVADPDSLQRKIFDAGLFASRHYFPSARLFGDRSCSVAHDLHSDILNLFNDFRVSEADAERLGRLVREHVGREVHASKA